MTDPIRPARVALRVSDVERSAAFYRDVVGLEVVALGLDAGALRAPGGDEVLLELRRACFTPRSCIPTARASAAPCAGWPSSASR